MMSDETQRQEGTVAGSQHIEQICAAFRKSLAEGRQPVIEEFLARVPVLSRNTLLQELTTVELGHLKAQGKQIELTEYYRRFPDHVECVDAANRLSESHRSQDAVSSDDPSSDLTSLHSSSASSLVSEGSHAWETRRVAQFQLLEHLGDGRFGSVWKARDTKLERTVALKIPHQTAASQRQLDLFFREARSAAAMRHANIVPVYEIGREGDTIFMATEFIQGVNLKQYLSAHGSRSPRKAAQFCAKIADALDCAHEAGVIHRDLKPSNIMVDVDGQPHVADFGLAKRKSVDLTLTVEGQVLGTPAYMSPEQAGGKAHSADHRTDVYALGVILFEMLTGELPFRGDRQMMILQKLRDRAPSPRSLNSRVPLDLETICLKCLEREADTRYQSARDLFDDLRRFAANKPIKTRPAGLLRRVWSWYVRSPHVTMVAAGGYMTFLAAILLSWLGLGLGGLALEIAPVKDAQRAMIEFACVLGAISIPMLYCGIRTLHSRLHGLLLGLCLLAACLFCISGWLPIVEASEAMRQLRGGLSGFQLMGLVSLLIGIGLAVHTVAALNQIGRQSVP